MKKIDTMTDYYTPWRSREFFSHKERLKELYPSLLQKPYFFSNGSFYLGLFNYTGNAKPDMNQSPDNTDLLITGILAAGKSMTLPQLNSYLLLRGVSLQPEELEQRISHMLHFGLIMRTTIYQKNHYHPNQGSFHPTHIDCYQVASNGSWFAKQIFAPQDFYTKNHGLAGTTSAMLYFYISSILWNQIVLNHLLYNPGFQYFDISFSQYLPDCGTFHIPLYIKTDEGNYIFSYVNFTSEHRMRMLFNTWESWQKHSQGKTTYVLTTTNSQELYKAKCWLSRESFFHENLDIQSFFSGTDSEKDAFQGLSSLEASLKDTVPTDNIAFSLIPDWFMDSAGVILPYSATKT